MKVLVTGAEGQLGYDVCRKLHDIGVEHRGVDVKDFDITSQQAVMDAIGSYEPTHVVHCAAYTAVDRAEREKDICLRVNGEGTANIARACKAVDAAMMYFSTDYVFDGFTKETPWDVFDPADPQGAYGVSKYRGEYAVREQLEKYYVMRISWVFGRNGGNFVKTMLNLAETRREISVVCDQFGAPTYTRDVAAIVPRVLESGKYGTYHSPNEGVTTWYDFAKDIFYQAGVNVKVIPVLTSEYPADAKRPRNSRLSTDALVRAGFGPLPHYHDALVRYLKEICVIR